MIAGLVILGIVAAIVYEAVHDSWSSPKNILKKEMPGVVPAFVTPLNLNHFIEGDTVTIAGNNLPENDHSIKVKFNDNSDVTISRQATNGFDVIVPHLTAADVTVKVLINDSSEFIVASNIPYTAKIPPPTVEQVVQVFPLRRLNKVIEGQNLIISSLIHFL